MTTDLNGNPLPTQYIPEQVHSEVIREAMAGNSMVIYSHWIASGHTIDMFKNQINQLEGKPLLSSAGNQPDLNGNPLPICIPEKTHAGVLGKLQGGDSYIAYTHWIASANTLVLYQNQIEALKQAQLSDRVIGRFLWKPVGEGGSPQYSGNPVILLDLENVQVEANGERLKDFGPSNGRGTTARSLKKCSQFSKPVELTFFEQDGRQISTKKGDKVVVEDPCSRKEWN